MWFDGVRQPNTIYVANTSRGKDSTAMLRAIQLMGWPLDMICSVDIWATETIPAELPPMVKFKDEYDQKVLDWFGVPVTRLCAVKRERERERVSYESMFYTECFTEKRQEHIYGFPTVRGGWCKRLKDTASRRETFAPDLRRYFLSNDQPQEREREREKHRGSFSRQGGNFRIYGWPFQNGAWCNSDLKRAALSGSQVLLAHGVAENSKRRHLRIPNFAEGQLVYTTQNSFRTRP